MHEKLEILSYETLICMKFYLFRHENNFFNYINIYISLIIYIFYNIYIIYTIYILYKNIEKIKMIKNCGKKYNSFLVQL